jgi:lysophospholipase L1-like esterase
MVLERIGRLRLHVGAALLVGLPAAALAANCAVTSVAFTPLPDLGTGTYQGYQGGLYPGGSNARPSAHDAAGRALAVAMRPIDGRTVLISIGMSNTTAEFRRFVPLAMNDPRRNPDLLVVDCAKGGQSADVAANPNSAYWDTVMARLAAAGATPEQVRAAWVKEAVPRPTQTFPDDALQLETYLRAIAMNLQDKFPNILITYFSSRIYAGYATGVSSLNPEPYAYQSGFAVKWLVADQIAGSDPGLNYDSQLGPVESPWIGWGPYLWADGLVPRSDGLTWECSDFAADGTHPSAQGAVKVADMLLDFFTSDATATPWFLAQPTAAAPPRPLDALLRVWPNPMRDRATIRLGAGGSPTAAGAAEMAVAIYDPAGRLIRLLDPRGGGGETLVWDRTDAAGRRVGHGVYLLRATTGQTAKLTVAR